MNEYPINVNVSDHLVENRQISPIKSAQLIIYHKERTGNMPDFYFNAVQPYQHFVNTLKSFRINIYGKKHLVVNLIQLTNQKRLSLNLHKSLRFVYEFLFRNVPVNLCRHEVIAKQNIFAYQSVIELY